MQMGVEGVGGWRDTITDSESSRGKADHLVDMESEIKGTIWIFQRASQGVNI